MKTSRSQQLKKNRWRQLRYLIDAYSDAAIHDSWKGGGDPSDIEVIELRLKLADAELGAYLTKLEREYS
jgi:hypothetical protein